MHRTPFGPDGYMFPATEEVTMDQSGNPAEPSSTGQASDGVS